MHVKQRCQSSEFLSRQGSTAFGGQNIEDPVEIEVPKISSQDRMLQRTVEQTLDESCVARERVQQRTAKSDKYGQELGRFVHKAKSVRGSHCHVKRSTTRVWRRRSGLV